MKFQNIFGTVLEFAIDGTHVERWPLLVPSDTVCLKSAVFLSSNESGGFPLLGWWGITKRMESNPFELWRRYGASMKTEKPPKLLL